MNFYFKRFKKYYKFEVDFWSNLLFLGDRKLRYLPLFSLVLIRRKKKVEYGEDIFSLMKRYFPKKKRIRGGRAPKKVSIYNTLLKQKQMFSYYYSIFKNSRLKSVVFSVSRRRGLMELNLFTALEMTVAVLFFRSQLFLSVGYARSFVRIFGVYLLSMNGRKITNPFFKLSPGQSVSLGIVSQIFRSSFKDRIRGILGMNNGKD
jgi:ribosomal protein S4